MLDIFPGPRRSVRLSVVVPFHRNLDQLRRCLSALKASALALPAGAELADFIVAADGAVDAPGGVADEAGARVVPIGGALPGVLPLTPWSRGASVRVAPGRGVSNADS